MQENCYYFSLEKRLGQCTMLISRAMLSKSIIFNSFLAVAAASRVLALPIYSYNVSMKFLIILVFELWERSNSKN